MSPARSLCPVLLSLCLCTAAASACKPGPGEGTAPGSVGTDIERQITLLDADDVEEREQAERELRGLGTDFLERIRGAKAVAGLEVEGRVRLARVIRFLESRRDGGGIWSADDDPTADVADILVSRGFDLKDWELHLISDSDLLHLIPHCRFVIADWVGAEEKAVLSLLFAVVREPDAVVQIGPPRDLVALAPHLPAAQDAKRKVGIAGALSGLLRLSRQFAGPFEFTREEARAPEGAAGTTRYAETADLVFDFDDTGKLVQVATAAEMQRKR